MNIDFSASDLSENCKRRAFTNEITQFGSVPVILNDSLLIVIVNLKIKFDCSFRMW